MFQVGERVIVIGEYQIWSVNHIDYSRNTITIVGFWEGKKHISTLELDWAHINLRIASPEEISRRDIRAIILNKEKGKAEAEERLNSVKRALKETRPKTDNWNSWKRDMFNDMTHELPEPTRKPKEEKPKEVKPLKRSIEF